MEDIKEQGKILLDQMTVEEKVAQLSCNIPLNFTIDGKLDEKMFANIIQNVGLGRITQAVNIFLKGPKAFAVEYNAVQKLLKENTKLGIPLMVQNETLGGIIGNGFSSFPLPISVASTWDDSYAKKIGKVIAKEGRAVGIHQGLSPVADVGREARWGRFEETYGEDVMLVSNFTSSMIQGMQGKSYRNNMISCAKHFLGYAQSERGFNASAVDLSEKTLLEVHATPFQAAINEGNLGSVMVTYSEVNGLPMTINQYYLQEVLRNRMGFKGSVMCDGDSIARCYTYTGISNNREYIIKQSLEAGIDADTPITNLYHDIPQIIEKNPELEILLNKSVLKILEQKINLGIIDNPYVNIDKIKQEVNVEETKELSDEIINKSITLLKNDGILPIKDDKKKITFVGEFANKVRPLFGGYTFAGFLEMYLTSAEGEENTMQGYEKVFKSMISKKRLVEELDLDVGLSPQENLENYLRKSYQTKSIFEETENIYKENKVCCFATNEVNELRKEEESLLESDVIIAVLGESNSFAKGFGSAGEGKNNSDLNLNKKSRNLMKYLNILNKPIVLVLLNGRPLSITMESEMSHAVIEMWHPGRNGSESLAKILKGVINPSGKLPVSIPKDASQCPIYYSHRPMSGYRPLFFNLKQQDEIINSEISPLYHFGFGLSYTVFKYETELLNKEVSTDGSFTLKVKVKNIGDYDGDEVIQVYTQMSEASISRPVLELKGYKRIFIPKGKEKTVLFTFDMKQFAYLNVHNQYVVEPVKLRLFVGSSSAELYSEYNIHLSGKELLISDYERVFRPNINIVE